MGAGRSAGPGADGSRLAAVAEDGDAAIDRVRPGEAGAAASAGLSLTAVREELELELAGLSGAGAVVPDRAAFDAIAARRMRLELRVKASVLVRRRADAPASTGSMPAANSASLAYMFSMPARCRLSIIIFLIACSSRRRVPPSRSGAESGASGSAPRASANRSSAGIEE